MSKRNYKIVNCNLVEAFEHPELGRLAIYRVKTDPDCRELAYLDLYDDNTELTRLRNEAMDTILMTAIAGLAPVTDRLN